MAGTDSLPASQTHILLEVREDLSFSLEEMPRVEDKVYTNKAPSWAFSKQFRVLVVSFADPDSVSESFLKHNGNVRTQAIIFV